MNYIFLGPPGAGKGTMAGMLCEQFGQIHISTGDILREEIRKGSDLGREAAEIMERGELVPDEVVAAIVSKRLGDEDVKQNGFLLDGYPRTVNQAELLEDFIRDAEVDLTGVVLLEVGRELLIKRLTARRICGGCGAVFNVLFSPPSREGVCDECGEDLSQRSDDNVESVEQRLSVYEEQTEPLVDFYDQRDLLIRVRGDRSKDENFSLLREALGL